MAAVRFDRQAEDPTTRARAGLLHTPHGTVRTPAFGPVGTQGTVKGLDPMELREAGCEFLLASVYHLYLRPGAETVAHAGGIRRFMAWDGPVVSDGGNWRQYSEGFGLEYGVGKAANVLDGAAAGRLRGQAPRIVRVDDDGLTFTSHVDGARQRFTPEVAVAVQERLWADIAMAFHGGLALGASARAADSSLERARRWSQRSLDARTRSDQGMLGVLPGWASEDLWPAKAEFLATLPFDGFAI